ncbi:THAP domain-containing protein 7 [Cheilinus undulatus]|uniref:THAP domain-containing protein 7 n=1 Tax=Cheilinus undulatus TaxID=241271 RepID=UPI001BD6968D|nr:THAP domain-containing protein 7 [Cheilinus undulatus]XP_041665336.1 THAP domain-containing protein 7 [Cheilinus undulatus]XP_041665337.1 THAP domain-containing protein 7 [Cheilinus undulatus]XP_041665338.1 THAP domain-containing protein 7 [Cheilinus undulatus]XP_041665339.1 THAP domain-containing protein 7 [Cheilinus undulatus]XP_041665340.1 THAP domain-containing protein 7 [Cheilinus undulatus]
MPRHCSAGGCKSRDNRESRNAGITFHKLPKGATRRNLWISNSRRADSWDPQSDFVYFCSQHFTPESFELTGYSGIRRLREDAFPTVFNSSTTAKPKRAGRLQKRVHAPMRKNLYSGEKENTEQEKDDVRPLEEPATESSTAAPKETPDKEPEHPPEVSASERLSQDEESPAEPEPRPVSPSRYMRRLPPPPGFYLSKEHSYAQLCPLLWRKRYDQAIDCLEKALRQLHAARRRENRLRSTVIRLRDKRLKQALLVSKDVSKDRRRRGGNLEGEGEDKCEDTGMFEDRVGEQMELGGRFLQDTSGWGDEERGRCFYCGRGQRPSGDVDDDTYRNDETAPLSTAEKVKDRNLESSSDSTLILQAQTPPGLPLPDVHDPLSSSQQKLVLSDGDAEAQQLFWIQDCAEGPFVLVPVPAEDGLQSVGVTDRSQTVPLAEFGHLAESAEGACGDKELVDQSMISMREDVREKLKEHLEGFHLQLSSEFLT